MRKTTTKRCFPASYRSLFPLGKIAWLQSEDAAAAVADGSLHANQITAELARIRKSFDRIAAIVPSPCRLEEHQETGHPFPPKPDRACTCEAQNARGCTACAMRMKPAMLMLSVKHEGHTLFPPIFLSRDGVTYDVVAQWIQRTESALDLRQSKSVSAYVFQRMDELNVRIIEPDLPSEDEADLRREIAEAEKCAKLAGH